MIISLPAVIVLQNVSAFFHTVETEISAADVL